MKKTLLLFFTGGFSFYAANSQETLQTVTDRGDNALDITTIQRSIGLGRTLSSGQSSFFGWRYNSGSPYGFVETYSGGTPFVLQALGGNVGIGATNPQAKLHITSGGVAATSLLAKIGGILESPTSYTGLLLGGAGVENNRYKVGMVFVPGDADYGVGSLRFLVSNTPGEGDADLSHEKMRIAYNGNVGIGTTSPAYKLDVNGQAMVRGELQSSLDDAAGGRIALINPTKTANGMANTWRIFNMTGAYGNSLQFWAYDNTGCDGNGLCNNRFTLMDNGNVGIGTPNAEAKMQIGSNFNTMPSSTAISVLGGNTMRFLNGDGNADYGSYLTSNTTASLTLGTRYAGTDIGVLTLNNSNVGIGTVNPTQKLSVDGTVLAKKVKVSQSSIDWPDYVFTSVYKLPSLQYVELFIQRNKHLPNVPSAADVKKEGLDLGDNQAVLLRKIEELTLYIIEQNKQLEEQKKASESQKQQLETQKQNNATLENRLSAIEKMLVAKEK
jgi:hypothetical protein